MSETTEIHTHEHRAPVAVYVTCDLCYRSHGASVKGTSADAVKAAYIEAGVSARNCDHTEGVNA